MLDPPLIPTLVAFALLILTIHKLLIHPLLLSPLSRIPPAHWSSPLTSLWILNHRLSQTDTPTLQKLHARLGPIIRLAPNEISVNCVNGGVRTIYSGGFEKGEWYSNVFGNYGVEPMFAMEKRGEHARRKRMLSHVYAKSTLLGSEALRDQTRVLIGERLRGRLRGEVEMTRRDGASAGELDGGVEVYDLFCAVTMDFVSAYIFGLCNGTDFIVEDRETGVRLFRDFKARQKYTFWPQECPKFTRFLDMLGLKWVVVPEWVDEANREIEAWLMGMCEKARETGKTMNAAGDVKVEKANTPSVYLQLESALVKEKMKEYGTKKWEECVDDVKLEIASELLDHTLAGFDTSSITLTWLAWELSKTANVRWQKLLQEEISTLEGSLDAKAIDSLPILHAILMETLRLHAAIPGQQPRVTPPNLLTTLGDPEIGITYTNIPPKTRVQSQAYTLHRNPTVFPEPTSWLPDRWLNSPSSTPSVSGSGSASSYTPRSPASLLDATRHFWAFGSGGRMCVGSNLAMLDMKATIVGVWGAFCTEIVDDEGMVPNGGYMAEPLGVGRSGKTGAGEGKGLNTGNGDGKGSESGNGEGEGRFLRLRVREVRGEGESSHA